MDIQLIEKMMNSAIMQTIMSSYSFGPAGIVSVPSNRDSADWARTAATMRNFCQGNCAGRWRVRAPMLENAMHFEFEIKEDAVKFKLFFG
jgi:hypothetical protein